MIFSYFVVVFIFTLAWFLLTYFLILTHGIYTTGEIKKIIIQ